MNADGTRANDILEGALLLERDFPEDYRAIRAILSKVAPLVLADGNHQLGSELANIVYGYRRDRPRSDYRRDAADLIDETLVLAGNLQSVEAKVKQLDFAYTNRIIQFMNNIASERAYDFGDILQGLHNAKLAASISTRPRTLVVNTAAADIMLTATSANNSSKHVCMCGGE